LFPAFSATVGAQTPSAEQVDIFRTLTPDQQQAILQSMGRGSSTTTRQGDSREQGPLDTRRGRLEGLEPEDLRRMEQEEFERQPRLKPRSTVLLSLRIREFRELAEEPENVPQVPTLQPGPGIQQPQQQQQQQLAVAPPERERIVRSDDEKQRLEELRTRILRRNPFELDKWGILNVPELGPIPLGGLTSEEARKRLAAEPLLADFVVLVTYLPVQPVGSQALKPFGHDLFMRAPDTFAPATNIPVPAEYVVGPGDNFEVQLIGNVRGRYTLRVGRDGRLNFPEVGPIAVAGLRFEAARAAIEERVREQLVGTQVSVQMGELRSVQIFVVGDAKRPGAYTVSGLSTITNALFVSGGVKEIGSLRNIQLKRNGQTITTFDLYDLLLRGDTRADARLLGGDVIFIPPIGRVVGVSGEIQRPALYELKNETTPADVIQLAGGLSKEADAKLATLERVDATRKRVVLDVDLTTPPQGVALLNGDVLIVPTVRSTVEDAVVVEGHVHRPGDYQYRAGLRISDVISSLAEFLPMADQHYVLIRREVPPTRRLEFLSVDMVKALAEKGTDADPVLAPRDHIVVFNLETGRDRLLQPLMRELRLQSSRQEPTSEVVIGGRVNIPGQYPLERGMRVSDLVRAGGSLSEAAYGGKAELTRTSIDGGETRETQLIEVDLAKAMAGDPVQNILLEPFDHLIIKELPLWGGQEYVDVQGEVRFPGRYPIQRGETLRSVVERAGGLTDLAFGRGAVFTREALKERERKQIDELIHRMQIDLAQVSLSTAQQPGGGDAAQALAVGQQLLDNLRSTPPVGRLVINLDRSMHAKVGTSEDVVLKDGDRLIVPRLTQEVTVIGEVQSPTSHLYTQNFARNDYIQMSGGTTQRADKSRTYVVRADGSVVGGTGNRWFGGDGGIDMQPGDTVVVPLDADRLRALPTWTAVSQIFYQLAIAVAAVNSF
jgi:protein involved in polysaccharide export with SLBB domain